MVVVVSGVKMYHTTSMLRTIMPRIMALIGAEHKVILVVSWAELSLQ